MQLTNILLNNDIKSNLSNNVCSEIYPIELQSMDKFVVFLANMEVQCQCTIRTLIKNQQSQRKITIEKVLFELKDYFMSEQGLKGGTASKSFKRGRESEVKSHSIIILKRQTC